ncbi:MAG: RNA polymerase sigma factor RpoD, partial [Clostridia bacterium]|nr:RNA polymerase sigma factor RpoD [Clostridia bacterium]
MPGAKTVDSVIKDLVDHGKSSGHISTNEILEAMGEMDFDPDQIESLYDSMESMGVEIVDGMDDHSHESGDESKS